MEEEWAEKYAKLIIFVDIFLSIFLCERLRGLRECGDVGSFSKEKTSDASFWSF